MTGGLGTDIFAISLSDNDGKDTITDFKFGEDILVLGDVFDGAGGDLQDLIDAGVDASSSGSTLTLYENGSAIASLTGWTGPQVVGIQDLSWALGGDLQGGSLIGTGGH
jgi:hypothetical protein